MKEYEEKKNDYIQEILEFTEKLSNVGNAAGVTLTISYFLIYTFTILRIQSLLTLLNLDQNLYIGLLKISLVYSPIIIISLTTKLILKKIKTVKFKFSKNLLISILDALLVKLIYPLEFFIFPLKFIIFAVFLCSKTLRNSYIGTGFQSYLLLAWVVLDFIFTLALTEIKVVFLRGFSHTAGFFCKLNGIFEEVITVVMPIILFLSIFQADPKISSSAYWIYFLIKVGLLFFTGIIYLRELPFFSKLTEKIYGHTLFLFTVFMTIYGGTERDLNTTLKIWCFILPFQVICLEYYLKRVYKINFLESSKQTNLLVVKKILLNCHTEQESEEKIYDYGVFKNHLINGKAVNREYLNIWKLKAKIKGVAKKKVYQKINTKDSIFEDNEEEEVQKIDFNEDESAKKIFIEIDNQVLNEFIKDSRGSNYSHLVKILWMLENRIVVNEILKSLGQMIGRAKSLKDKFMYRYAKRRIQETLKGYYFHKDIHFNKTSKELKEKKIIKIEQELKKINDVGVDMAYAFKYREKTEKMVTLIEEFVQTNKKYLGLLGAQSKSLNELNELTSKLFNLKGKIEYAFDQVHSDTRNVEATHLTPYFYFLVKCINLHRSASKIFKIYKQRMINRRNLIDEKLMVLKDINLFSQSLIIMVDSKPKSFGTILEVYGDSKYLKVSPLELKGKHMDCLIMESHRSPHSKSCDVFNNEEMSPIIGDTVKSFIKLPTKDLILPVTYNIKIIPYEETDFKYVVGVKYNRADSKMYILLDKVNKIDSFSYNMKYITKSGESFLDKKTPLSVLSKDCFDKVVKIDKEVKKMKKKIESGSFESTNQATNTVQARKDKKNLVNEYDSKPSFSNYGSNFEQDFSGEDVGFLAKFLFRNKFGDKELKRTFKVKIERKSYVFGNFNYKVLILEMNDQGAKNSLLDFREKNSVYLEAAKKANEGEIEEEFEQLPQIETDRNNVTHSIRNSTSEYKFLKHKTNSLKTESEKKLPETENKEIIEEKLVKKKDKRNILDEETVFEKSNPENKINIKDEVIGNRGTNSKSEKSLKNTIKSDQSQGYENIIQEADSDLFNEKVDILENSLEEEEFDEEKNFSDLNRKQKMIEGTGSVFSNSNIQTHKKYFAFEDAVKKRAGLMETLSIIVLYILSIGATVFFTIYIQSELEIKNYEYYIGNDVYTAFCEHALENQMFYSKLLGIVAYNKGIYKKERYSKYNFTGNPMLEELNSTNYAKLGYDLADFETYAKHEIEVSRDNMIRLLNKIYKYMGKFGDNNKKLFEEKIIYNQHEVNGTAIKKTMGIYQGYLLLTTTNAIEITNLDIKDLKPEGLNRDLLYFLDNSMNGIPIAFEKFNDFLLSLMIDNYNEFMSFVYLCLFIIIGLTVVLLFASTCSILNVKKMFSEIFQCFLGISKSEYDERSSQLNVMNKMLDEFKSSNFFKDFMSFNDFTLPKKSSSKKGKKYTDGFYCFKLLYSVGFIILFYTIQLCFASGMMLIFRDSVQKGIWICVKQDDLKQVIMDEFFYYNTIKQKLVLGDDKTVFNQKTTEYIPTLREERKKNSESIMKLFEDRDDNAYIPLKDYLSDISNSSICSYTSQLLARKELCPLLDNKLPLRGIVQVYFRVAQYLDEIYSQIGNSNFDSTGLLNDAEFIEFEYTFEQAYYWTFVFIEHKPHSFFSNYIKIDMEKEVVLIVNLMVIFIVVSFFFIVFSFQNVIRQVSRVSFTFQLLSINTVINNTGIKYRFLKVYRLNQKHF